MKAEGNTYFLEELGEGIYSFRHVQTGEILHGSVGPVKEARDLYMGSSGLLKNASETLVVFDVGMGCGAQLLALLDFLNSDDAACSKLRIFSFDLEKNGLSALLAAADYFPNVQQRQTAKLSNGLLWPAIFARHSACRFLRMKALELMQFSMISSRLRVILGCGLIVCLKSSTPTVTRKHDLSLIQAQRALKLHSLLQVGM